MTLDLLLGAPQLAALSEPFLWMLGLPSPLRSADHPLEAHCFGSLKSDALDSPSSSLYYFLCSSRENLFAFYCICLLVLPK